MAPSYPELATGFGRISSLAYAEEETFRQTLRAGTTILDTAVRETKAQGGTTLSAERAFPLHDTYGFPIDLTLEMAAEQGLEVDEEGFRRLMLEQRERAKADSRAKKIGHADLSAYREVLDAGGPTTFTGYDEVVSEARVLGLLVDGVGVPAASEGDDVELVLDRTPFYAEGGGQLADQGVLRFGNGAEVEVHDVQTPLPGVVVHRGTVTSGEVVRDDTVTGEVDVARRRAISRAHTATHLVHKAFRQTLGETATQAGSENAPGRFRFDFASPSRGARRGAARRRAGGQRGARRRPRRARRGDDPGPGAGGRARWRCSARSTATRCGSSRSATGPASSAAAPTPSAPASSAWSRSSARPRSAPACAGSRRWSAPTPTSSWPASTRWSPSSPRRSRCARRSCRTGSPR